MREAEVNFNHVVPWSYEIVGVPDEGRKRLLCRLRLSVCPSALVTYICRLVFVRRATSLFRASCGEFRERRRHDTHILLKSEN